MTANLHERNRFDMGDFWRGSQPIFDAKCFVPARFAVPGAPSLTALSRHDSHSSLPSCPPSGGRSTHQCVPGKLIHVFFNRGHFPNMVFTLFLFKCSDCTLWRSGTASLTVGTRNLQEEALLFHTPPSHEKCMGYEGLWEDRERLHASPCRML